MLLKPSAEDQASGKLHEVKGTFKELAGKTTNDPELEGAGKAENKAGKAQTLISRVEKAVGE